jgi:hypothetical protein
MIAGGAWRSLRRPVSAVILIRFIETIREGSRHVWVDVDAEQR